MVAAMWNAISRSKTDLSWQRCGLTKAGNDGLKDRRKTLRIFADASLSGVEARMVDVVAKLSLDQGAMTKTPPEACGKQGV